jgi:GTPase SAR1 family protein
VTHPSSLLLKKLWRRLRYLFEQAIHFQFHLFHLYFQDTAGSERYEAMSRIYYRGAKAAIICFDLTEQNSFEKVKFWVKELAKNEEVSISGYSIFSKIAYENVL